MMSRSAAYCASSRCRANTSFGDFPRLCRCVAQDGFLPRPFAVVGRRLVFSIGILYLAITAGVLLIVFGGITDRLIPLFAIGAFLTFTMSQAGMVVHWLHTHHARRLRSRLRRFGGSRLVIIELPWYLEEPHIEQGLVEAAADTAR